jgi:hypothetical protein
MTHHNQIKKLTTWFLGDPRGSTQVKYYFATATQAPTVRTPLILKQQAMEHKHVSNKVHFTLHTSQPNHGKSANFKLHKY